MDAREANGTTTDEAPHKSSARRWLVAAAVLVVVIASLWALDVVQWAMLRGVDRNSPRMVRLAMALGGDPRKEAWGGVPLVRAGHGCKLAVLDALLKRPSVMNSEAGDDALDVAVTRSGKFPKRCLAAVEKFLDVGVNPDYSAHALCSVFGTPEVIELLLKRGADPNRRPCSGDGLRPLGYQTRPNILKLLLDHGAEIDAIDREGHTALHSIIKPSFDTDPHGDRREAVAVLLDHGIDANATDADGATALDYAYERGDNELAELLRQRGAKAKKHESLAAAQHEKREKAKETEYDDLMRWGSYDRKGAPCHLSLIGENKAVADEGTGWGIERGTIGTVHVSCGEAGYVHYVVMGMGARSSAIPKRLNMQVPAENGEITIEFNEPWTDGMMQWYFSKKPVDDFIDALKYGHARRIAVRHVTVGG